MLRQTGAIATTSRMTITSSRTGGPLEQDRQRRERDCRAHAGAAVIGLARHMLRLL
jgi:hypothetical protein